MQASAATDPLLFDPDDYTAATKTASAEDGVQQVTYHAYTGIVYVANPVDEKYQSLNVQVPVETPRGSAGLRAGCQRFNRSTTN